MTSKILQFSESKTDLPAEEVGETQFVETNACVEPTAQRAVAQRTAFE